MKLKLKSLNKVRALNNATKQVETEKAILDNQEDEVINAEEQVEFRDEADDGILPEEQQLFEKIGATVLTLRNQSKDKALNDAITASYNSICELHSKKLKAHSATKPTMLVCLAGAEEEPYLVHPETVDLETGKQLLSEAVEEYGKDGFLKDIESDEVPYEQNNEGNQVNASVNSELSDAEKFIERQCKGDKDVEDVGDLYIKYIKEYKKLDD